VIYYVLVQILAIWKEKQPDFSQKHSINFEDKVRDENSIVMQDQNMESKHYR
jgi:hypothetical protein